MVDDQKRMMAALEDAGYKAKILPIARVDKVVGEMHALFRSDRLNPAFAARYKDKFQLDWRSKYPNARSVIVLAVPVPILRLGFTYRGARREVVVPPGYSYTDIETKVEQLVKKTLGGSGFDCQWLQGVPLKLLSVRSGLCLYGRNNITYCEGLGSVIQLYGLATDMESPEDVPLRPAARMPECGSCEVCACACPSGSIDLHTQIIHAERCITYLNENGGEFPDWLEPSVHNAIVGCMVCQRVCPKNRGLLSMRTIEDVFDEADIDAICAGGEFSELPERTRNVLKAYNLDDYWRQQALSRNLRALQVLPSSSARSMK